jgi:hypothetical protein
MAYTHMTWASFRSTLLDHLDPLGVFYTDSGATPEVASLLVEALREWNCLTSRYKRRVNIDLVPGQLYYNLHTLATFPQVVTDQSLVNEMAYHLLEPPQAAGWVGVTSMFTQAEIWAHMNRVRDKFLADTGILLSEFNSNPLLPGETITIFNQDVMDPRRVLWRDVAAAPGFSGGFSGPPTHLWRSDEFEGDTALQSWRYQARPHPIAWSIVRPEPLQIRIIPGATVPGFIDILATRAGATMVAGVPSWVGVPDDLAWGIKWGVMGDLLSHEGPVKDPERAEYCKQRYDECVEIAKTRAIVIGAQITGKWLPVTTMHDMDASMPRWMVTTGPPKIVGVAGYTMAVGPMPDHPYRITLDIVESTPYDFASFVQLGKEELDTVIEMGHHLGSFKEQGAEWKTTFPLRVGMLEDAAQLNDRVRAMSIFKDVIQERGRQDENRKQRVEPLEE